jgi:hypothetical protein
MLPWLGSHVDDGKGRDALTLTLSRGERVRVRAFLV